ncbi:MAG: type II secretion system inner membrane protein GspF [Chromatiales bacterium]|nr:type II secretion system inner membrane protein GspF [Chromatiales bacterium]
MPAFAYTALKPTGRKERGVMEGDNAHQVRQLLREGGLTPLDVSPVERREQPAGIGGHLWRKKMTAADLALFTRQLATLLHAGSPLEEALATISRQTHRRSVKGIILAVRARVVEGHPLASGLADYPQAFPELYRATVAAGEESGYLDAVLERLADYTESRQSMHQRLVQAMLYPALLSIMALAVLAGLLGFVVPKVVEVFDNLGQELPLLTRALLASSDIARDWGIVLLIAAALLIAGFFRLMRRPAFRHRVHALQLRLPLFGALVRGLNAARFARTLSILAASGVPILQALQISAQVISNLPMRTAVEQVAVRVREGTAIHRALEDAGHFPPMTIHLIASGESSGELDNMLERAATQQERETDATIAMALGVFEPLLIIAMGGVVLLIVLAILLPIFESQQMFG